jgi:hypothetical protein
MRNRHTLVLRILCNQLAVYVRQDRAQAGLRLPARLGGYGSLHLHGMEECSQRCFAGQGPPC